MGTEEAFSDERRNDPSHNIQDNPSRRYGTWSDCNQDRWITASITVSQSSLTSDIIRNITMKKKKQDCPSWCNNGIKWFEVESLITSGYFQSTDNPDNPTHWVRPRWSASILEHTARWFDRTVLVIFHWKTWIFKLPSCIFTCIKATWQNIKGTYFTGCTFNANRPSIE